MASFLHDAVLTSISTSIPRNARRNSTNQASSSLNFAIIKFSHFCDLGKIAKFKTREINENNECIPDMPDACFEAAFESCKCTHF